MRESFIMLPGVALPQPFYKKILVSVLFAVAIFCLGIAVDRLVAVSGWVAWLDDAAAAAAIGLLIYLFERHREQVLLERLQTIALMNHHVRNALQVLAYSQYERDRTRQAQIIRDAILRIDWALKEILGSSRAMVKPQPVKAA